MIGSYVLKPYIGLEPKERDYILILCSINLIFSGYYTLQALKLEKIFRLENREIIKFAKKLAVITFSYIPHLFFIISLFLQGLNEIEILMIILVFIIELMLVGLILKEIYDLIFLEQSRRDFEIEENRKKYLEKEKRSYNLNE